MKFPKLILVISWLTMAVAITCSSNSVDPETEAETEEEVPDQEHFMNAFEMNEVLGKGINLGNALEAPEEGEWDLFYHT